VHTYGVVRNTPPPCGQAEGRAEYLGCGVTPGARRSSAGLLAVGLAAAGLAWRRRRRSVSAVGGASR
jgi:hypothetical protein